MSTLRLFIAPSRYVQGPGALDELGPLLAGRVGAVAVLVDAALDEALSPRLRRSLEGEGIGVVLHAWSGEVTRATIGSLAVRLQPSEPDVVVAVGGGKTLDTGKGVAVELGVGIVTVPTIASNDGPTSRTIAEYDDDHLLIATPQMAVNPEIVVVDTALINRAPARFLLSGIGDAVAKRFEAAGCRRVGGSTPNGGRPLEVPGAIAEACYRIIDADAAAALAGLGSDAVSPALERVVEAVILMSGLAFENGGLSVAHALTRGLMRAEGGAGQLHGFQVAYGLLVQLAHEKDAGSFDEVRRLFGRIGLPRTLAELGPAPSEAAFGAIATAALTAPHAVNTVPAPTAATLVAAMAETESDVPERSPTWT